MTLWKSQNNSDSRSEGMEEGGLEKGMGGILEGIEMLLSWFHCYTSLSLSESWNCAIKDEFLQHVNYLNKLDFET